MSTHMTTHVALSDRDIQLIMAVLRDAANRAGLSVEIDTANPDGAALVDVVYFWQQIVENGVGCEVVNFDGERLFGIYLNAERREIICAQLTYYCTRLMERVENETLQGAEDEARARQAYLLSKKISEAARGN